MSLIKALLIGLTSVPLCIADISGIVTETSSTAPIAGAIVKLEQGGQADTTDSNGKFLITSSITGISSHLKTEPQALFAAMKNGFLHVNVAAKTTLQITTFDLTGKVLSTVRKSMDAGNNSLGLPYRGSGIYLYEVKAGDKEVVLKGNSVVGVSSVSTESSQGSSSNNPLEKQAKGTAAIDDVIAVTKEGYLNYRVVAYNSDTTGIAIKMIASAGTVTDIDGNVYQTVKIGNLVWMTENLRVTTYNDKTPIPLDKSGVTWTKSTTPKYCVYNNTTNADSIKKYGALYNWYVVNPVNPKKIAPTGWHVPTDAEWDTLQNYLIAKGYNGDGSITGNKIAKSMAAKTDWQKLITPGAMDNDLTINNESGFSALPCGYRDFDGVFFGQKYACYWWCAAAFDASSAFGSYLIYDYSCLFKDKITKNSGFSLRLVKD
jgi:uncharacterized protein (TIGR02145 family)